MMNSKQQQSGDWKSKVRSFSDTVFRNYQIMRMRWDISTAEKKRTLEISRLGNMVFRLHQQKSLTIPELEPQIEKIGKIDQEIKILEEKLRDILLRSDIPRQLAAGTIAPVPTSMASAPPAKPATEVRPVTEVKPVTVVKPATEVRTVTEVRSATEVKPETQKVEVTQQAKRVEDVFFKNVIVKSGVKTGESGVSGRQDTKKVAKVESGSYSGDPSVKADKNPVAKASGRKQVSSGKPADDAGKKESEPKKR